MRTSSRTRSVQHPIYGSGEIQSWRRGGRLAVVSFDSQPLPIEVPARELNLSRATEGEADDPQDPKLQEMDGLEGTFDSSAAALTLEAMRLGVVPTAQLDAYTVGRDFEMGLVQSDLVEADACGAVRAFLGDYGVGKTHLLELIQQEALDNGFLAARVVLDPEETSPAHPKRVYRAAIRTLRYPDRPYEEGSGLGPLLAKAAAAPEALAQFGLKPRFGGDHRARLDAGEHLYLTPAIEHYRALLAVDEHPPKRVAKEDREVWAERHIELLLDWLEGHPTVSNQDIDTELAKLPGKHDKVYSLLDYRPWARIYGYLISGIAALARTVGYKGLVVLLDEAEFYGLLTPQNRSFARFLFKAWTWAAVGGNTETESLPFDADELEFGGYGIQKELPGRYQLAPGLYMVLAMTPHSDGYEALSGAIPEGCISQLQPLEPVDYVELARRVCDFYASSRPNWNLPAALVDPLSRVLRGLIQSGYVTNPRHAMKFIIEFLDIVRYHPERVGSVVRNLQESLLF